MLRIPYCLDSWLTDGGKVVSRMHWPHFTTHKHYFSASGTRGILFFVVIRSGTHFCYRLSEPQSLVRQDGLGKLKKFIDLIESRTRVGDQPSLRSRKLCCYSTSQSFMEPQGSLPCSQEPLTGPYPETDQSSPYHPFLRSILILYSHRRFGLPSGLFWRPRQNPPLMLRAHPISSSWA
jgi:hypothetical protein